MENNQISPEVFLCKGCNKGNNSLPQIQIIYNYLLENTATAEAAGGVYFIAKDFKSFYKWYNNKF